MYVVCVPDALRGQEASDPLELDLRLVESPVGARNQTQASDKSSKCP